MRNLFSLLFILCLAIFTWQCGGETADATAMTTAQPTAAPTTAKAKVATPSKSTPKGEGTVLKGQIKNANDLTLFVEQYSYMDNVHDIQGRQTVGADGNFEIALDELIEPGIYRFRLGRKKMYIPFNGGEKEINLTADINTFDIDNIQVTGSDDFDANAKILSDLLKRNLDESKAENAAKTLSNPILASFVAYATFGGNPKYLPLQKEMNAKLAKALPGSPIHRKHTALVNQLELTANDPIQIGKIPPNITLTDPDGKTRSLDELKGKVILLDFWASWCGPCRRENPNVVNVYDKYNKQGFDVFSVSLDKANGKQRWIQAIAKDNLKWPHHVSDLQGWQSAPAKEYKVSSIPRTFLLDKEGRIADMNVRGPDLEIAVKKLLGKG